MANLPNLNAEAGADFIGDDIGPALTIRSSATEGWPVTFDRTVVSSPTVAVARLSIDSTASAPVFELSNQAFVSVTTILFTTGATAGVGVYRMKHGDNYKWVPMLPDGSVTAAARG